MGHLKIGGDKSSSDSKRLLVGGKQKVDTPLGPESPRKNQGTTLRPTGLRQHRWAIKCPRVLFLCRDRERCGGCSAESTPGV